MNTSTMTVVRIAFRDNRAGVIAMTAIGAVFAFINASAYAQIGGSTVAERVAFGQQMEVLARQFTYLLPLPERVDTVGGYLHWRAFGVFSLMFGVWGVMAGTGSTRAQEERGNWEMWLAAGARRVRLMVLTAAGFILAVAVPMAVIGVAAIAGSRAGATLPGDALGAGAVFGEVLALLLLTLACFSIGVVAAQVVSSGRAALGVGATAAVGLFFLNSLSRTLDGLNIATWLSPFFWFDRTNAMVPGGSLDLAGVVVLMGASAVLTTAATAAFVRRDVGSALFGRATRERATYTVSNNPLLRIPVVADVYEQRMSLAFWAVGVVLMAGFIGSSVKSALDFLRESPTLAPYLETFLGGDNVYEAMLGYTGFNLMQLILAAFAVTIVGRWASDDTEGRLEIMLSAPISRWRIVVERAAMLAVVSLALILLSTSVMAGTVAAQGVDIGVGRMLWMSTLLLPFALSFAGAGAALATWLPRVAVTSLSVVAAVSFLLVQVGPLLRWPTWVLNLSVFSLTGNPVVDGVYWTGLAVLLAVAVGGFGVALRNIQVRDVGR